MRLPAAKSNAKATAADSPTMMSRLYRGGKMKGTDDSVWLYGVVPMEAVTSAKTNREAVAAGNALAHTYQALSQLTNLGVRKTRAFNRANYRQTHLLLINTPKPFEPPKGHPNYEYWLRNYGGVQVEERILLIGVKLKDKIGGENRGYREMLDSFTATLTDGGTPIEDYDPDAKIIRQIFDASAIEVPTKRQIDIANGYWDYQHNPDVAILPHHDHMHFFNDGEGIRIANTAGKEDCENWLTESTWQDGAGNAVLPGESSLSFSVLSELEMDTSSANSIAKWVSNALHYNARVVSIRAKVEPCTATYTELRSSRRKVESELQESLRFNKMSKSDVEEKETYMADLDVVYASPDGPGTLVDVTVVIGTEGAESGRNLHIPGVKTTPALLRQAAAWYETMLCSGTICQPRNDDFSIPVVANSGIQSLAECGEDGGGALLGFTELDRQPAYISATVAADEDSSPLMLVAGQTGSGKSMVLLHLADQFAREGRPQVIIDPKRGSFHDAAIQGSNPDNTVVPLGSLAQQDGIFDPIRFSPKNTEEEINDAIILAVGLLLEINPWGTSERVATVEPRLARILRYGVVEGGADCIGAALAYAFEEHPREDFAPWDIVGPVIEGAENDPFFRSMCGLVSGGKSMSVGNGITYIRVGNTTIGTPASGKPTNLIERTACALVRMMVFASSMAVSGRNGVVHLDEAWIFLQSNPKEIDKLARLARSQLIFPILYTQKVSDALEAGVHGAIGRSLILSIKDRNEARYACQLIGVEQTEERLNRITSLGVMGSKGKTPNPNSMRPLFDPENPRRVLRGAIGIYNDFHGRAANVEVTIAAEFLAKASTNPLDIAKRKALAEEEARQAATNFAQGK